MLRRSVCRLVAITTLLTGVGFAALPAMAGDVTMNLGFGAPEAEVHRHVARYGRQRGKAHAR